MILIDWIRGLFAKEELKTFSELMIAVDQAESAEELVVVSEYLVEQKRYFTQAEKEFAREHIAEKIALFKKQMQRQKVIN